MTTEDTRPLIGEVNDLFTAVSEESIAASIENARLEQELVCGYPLVVKSTRHIRTRNMQGQDVYEIFATFAPAETPAEGEAA